MQWRTVSDDVEIELGIAFVGLRFAQIPGGARATHHDTGKTPTPCVRELDHPDSDVALLEDAIFRQLSSQTLRKGAQNAQMSSSSFGGKSRCTLPTRK